MLVGGGDLERARDAELGDEVEAGDQRAGDRAGGVDGVEQADLAADAILAGDRGLDHQRQRGAHHRRRHDQHAGTRRRSGSR